MPLFRRRPLLRAAAVGGGAYMLGKHRARAEAEEQSYEATQPFASPAPAAPARSGGLTAEDTARLKELAQLREQGILTDEEFAQQKALILKA